jgi:hypothetical protein
VGQPAFEDGQVARFGLDDTDDWQDVVIQVPTKGNLLHFRILVPASAESVEIAMIRLESGAVEKRIHTWDFASAK